MAKRMLIDAAHPEETRVAVLKGNRLEDFDFETATKKQLKGNIYLAKVTRVEPSLQAAFVDYGGNRHGFLAFNEIHPDYYRIPVADREALLAQEKALAEHSPEGGNGTERGDSDDFETIGGDDIEEVPSRRFRPPRSYKIQEVTKRRQIMLVQVVKEERGNKGAALTTYLSLAGRYCVLMPNTPRGGGVSRKITNLKDRRRLKSILEEFEIPEGMSVIVRTAGMERSKAEIKRDLEYLMRLWDEIRTVTLQSTAPALIYEEANLIKRAIRDLYDRDIDEIQVEGEDGYRAAKDFMRMLTPSHAKRVQLYNDEFIPLFHRYQVESQIDAIHSPVIQLRSGGYIVITPTEALVSIDVNSGRATKERNIEETALRTNLEAAEEISRQVRLRDLAGLIVIDFIDMEESRNNAAVERRLKEAMRSDRARIQIGRISAFGLLELSRQRLRPSLVEATMEMCTHCGGTGWVRSIESTALHVLRGLEEEGTRQRSAELKLTVPTRIALYLLNQKRANLADIERRYRFCVAIDTDDNLIPPSFRLERLKALEIEGAPPAAAEEIAEPSAQQAPAEAEEAETESVGEGMAEEAEAGEERPAAMPTGDGQRRRRRRRRRRRGRGGEEAAGQEVVAHGATPPAPGQAMGIAAAPTDGSSPPSDELPMAAEPHGEDRAVFGEESEQGEGEQPHRRARGRRGGRRRRRGGERPEFSFGQEDAVAGSDSPRGEEPILAAGAPATTEVAPETAPESREAGESDRSSASSPEDWSGAIWSDRAHEEGMPSEVDIQRNAVTEPQAVEPSWPSRAPQPDFSHEAIATEAPPPPSGEFGGPHAGGEGESTVPSGAASASPETTTPSGTSAEAGAAESPRGVPVITVGEQDDQRPKKRGWWRRLSE
ncbi:MAG TPA: Rne/Rng family ribonuclease [Alphaproteobacteria bacterium]|nr:Rne/Rng family ribonuclease [Alphaproteobacteria bacterium]